MQHRLACVVLVALAACGSSERAETNLVLSQIEGFPYPIYEQETTDREWREVGLEAAAELGASEEHILYQPSSIVGSSNGGSYILDYGDMMVKQFNGSGEFVRTYGHGGGEGPGEFTNPMRPSIGATGGVEVPDAVLSSIARFGPDGALLETFTLDFQPFRMAIADGGRYYFMASSLARNGGMFGTTGQLDQPLETFGTSDLEPLGLGGEIVAVGSDLVYSPTHFGFIARFTASGDVVYARETLDQVEPPVFETLEIMGGPVTRFKSRTFAKYILAYSEGMLYVDSRVLSAERGATVVDVFGARDGSYTYSFEVPGRWRDLDVAGNYLFALGDTLGTVFEFTP